MNITLKDFITTLSSKSPVPGGGGASALVGAVSVALCSMVANLTSGKKKYDILIACAGKAKMITSSFTNLSQIIIDVGINFENNKLCGDVNFEEVADNVYAITPVPGGVGTVTTSVLLKHTIISAERL